MGRAEGTTSGAEAGRLEVVVLPPIRVGESTQEKEILVVWPLSTKILQGRPFSVAHWPAKSILAFSLPSYTDFYERGLQPSTGMAAARPTIVRHGRGLALQLRLPRWASRGAIGVSINGALHYAPLESLPLGNVDSSVAALQAPERPLGRPEGLEADAASSPLRVLDVEVVGAAIAGQRVSAQARLLAASPEALSGYSIIEWYLGDTPSLVGQGAGFDLLAEDVGKTLRVRAVPVAADGTVYTSIWKDLGSVRVGATASQGASITRDRVVVDYRQDPQIAFPVEVFGGEPLVVSLPSSDHLTAREVSRVVSEEIRAGLTEQSIKSVLGALDMLYVNAGLSGARALLRPQDTSQGLLEIALLEPRIGQVLFVGTRRAAIAQALTPQVIGRSGEPLDLGRVDAGLAATNESSRHRYRAVLREGREFGQSDLVVAVSEASLTDISLGANNLGARETGRSLSSARFALYPEVGLLDGVSASAVKAEGLRLTSGGADLKLPLPGATLGVVHTEIETKYIMGPAAQLDASGRSKSDTYRLSMPIYRQAPWVIDGEFVHGRDKNGTAYLGQLIQSNTKAEKNQFAVTVRRSSIPLSSAKLGLQASASVSRGRHVTYGVDDLETRVKSLRRAYALSATVDFPQGYLLQARFDYARLAASDPDSAPGSEKYVVGSDKSRGYDQGQAIGDQGLAFSIELSGKYSPVSFTDRDEPDFLWRPRIFYDAAAARSYAALTPDQKSVRGKRFRPYRDEVYSSLGLGMQLQTAKGLLRSGALDGYIAIPLDDSVSGRARSARVGFSVSTLF